MFPQGNFLFSTFLSAPFPAMPLTLAPVQVWAWILVLVVGCCPALGLFARPWAAHMRGTRAPSVALSGAARRPRPLMMVHRRGERRPHDCHAHQGLFTRFPASQ